MIYDCVIVGAGAVGASLAVALGRLGLQVLLLEKKAPLFKEESVDSRTIALSYASSRIYEALDVWDRIQPYSVPIQSVHVCVKGQFGSTCLKPSREHAVLGYVVGIDTLEKQLLAELATLQNVRLLQPACIQARENFENTWRLQILVEDKIEEVSTYLLVASDGVNSVLREEQSIHTHTQEYDHYAVLTNLCFDATHPFRAYERFLEQGAIALLPWRENIATCIWTTNQAHAQHLLALEDDAFVLACQEQFGYRLGRFLKVGKRHFFPLHMKLASQQSSVRFLLMGNAAHNLHPIAAQGLNLSLRDVWQVRKQAISANQAHLGSQAFLSEYHQAREGDQSRIIFATDKIARYLSGGVLPAWLRAAGITLFDCIAPLKQKFTSLSMGLP